jgi:uncharacterized protein YggE
MHMTLRPLATLAAMVLVAATGAGLATRGVQAQIPAGEAQTGIRVRGQGTVVAPPDLAVLSISATARREQPGEAFQRVAGRVTALTQTLRAAGVPEADIQTQQISLFQEYTYPPNEEPRFAGWRARQSLIVNLRDFARIGGIISDAVATLEDTAELGGVSFTIENPDPLADRARAAAATDARRKAETLAANAGARLGRLVFLQEVSAPGPTPQRVPIPTPTPRPPAALPVPAPIPVPVTPGEIGITVIVDALYAIE